MKKNGNEVNGQRQRVDELLAPLTLREKLGQCVMIEPCFCLAERTSEQFGEDYSDVLDPRFLAKLLDDYCIGAFLFGGVSRIGDGSPHAWADYIATVREYAKTTRHRIPPLFGIDAVHGVNFMKGSTIYPHNLAVAASWNPGLAERYAQLVGAELSAIGFNCNFAPTIDVARDTRWGRVYESLGEDPSLAAAISLALVRGMQANDSLAACAKHFIGYGESRNGMDRTPADLSDRSILETHAPPFEAAIEADVRAIMLSGGDVNGMPMPASRRLMTDLLRGRLGFQGVTMSDWEDVERLYSRHKVAADRKAAIVKAFNAGLDMNMAVCNIGAVDIMEEAVAEGSISMDRVDQAVRNILSAKLRLGLFAEKDLDVDNASVLVGSKPGRTLAQQMVLESVTLLKNDGGLLPLAKDIGSILVTGRSANSKRHLCGGWTLGWAGAQEEDLDCKTLLDALQETVSSGTEIVFIDDPEQMATLGDARDRFDVCISVVSEEPHAEWVGDSMELGFEDYEDKMLRAAVATGLPVVMVALIGRPLNASWADANVAAMLWAYLPGTEAAEPIAGILCGEHNPSGRLPISFPRDGCHIPVVYNARSYTSDEINTAYDPLYAFGFGLSYTSFAYSDLCVPEKINVGQDVAVSIRVENTGAVDGSEVVQLYLKDKYASVTRPLRSLKAFTRVTLRAGESQTVTFSLVPGQLGLYDEDLEFVVEPRVIEVLIGDQSGEFRIVGSA